MTDSKLTGISITQEEVGLAVSSGHPLAGREIVTFRDLKNCEKIRTATGLLLIVQKVPSCPVMEADIPM